MGRGILGTKILNFIRLRQVVQPEFYSGSIISGGGGIITEVLKNFKSIIDELGC